MYWLLRFLCFCRSLRNIHSWNTFVWYKEMFSKQGHVLASVKNVQMNRLIMFCVAVYCFQDIHASEFERLCDCARDCVWVKCVVHCIIPSHMHMSVVCVMSTSPLPFPLPPPSVSRHLQILTVTPCQTAAPCVSQSQTLLVQTYLTMK